jgi:hypothetical protein
LGILELDRTDCYSGHLPPQFDKQFTIYQLPQGLSVSWNSRCKSVFGFGYRNEPLILPMGSNLVIAATRSWSVPFWSFVAVTSVLPLLFFHDARKRRRRRLSHRCERCGYNLTGNASGVCPECGDPVSHQAASSEDGGTLGAIPARLRLLVLAHVFASWAVGLGYTALMLYFGRGFSIVRWSLELVFAPVWVLMSAVLVPIEIARRLPVAPPGFLARVLFVYIGLCVSVRVNVSADLSNAKGSIAQRLAEPS